jgi:DNA-binding transcriptional regulator GbsR (MarR family)
MGNGSMKMTEKDKGIPLEVLAKQLNENELRKKLETAYAMALASAMKNLSTETVAYTKKAEKTKKDLVALADFIESLPDCFAASITRHITIHGENADKYRAKIEEIKKERISMTERLKRFATLISEAKAEGCEITIRLSVKVMVNDLYAQYLASLKKKFVDSTSKIITDGLRGGGAVRLILDVGNDRVATSMANVLEKEIGVKKPDDLEEDTIITFEQARITKGHYPIAFHVEGQKLLVSWPEWIERTPQEMDFTNEEKETLDLRTTPRKLADRQ